MILLVYISITPPHIHLCIHIYTYFRMYIYIYIYLDKVKIKQYISEPYFRFFVISPPYPFARLSCDT